MAMEDRAITIIGCGPGGADYVTPAALDAVNRADVLVGAQRLLDLFPAVSADRIAVGSAIEETLDQIQDRLGHNRIAVLVSGDPGLFSLARFVIRRFGRASCRIIPGLSSVQTAFARIGLEWGDAVIISAHKQNPEHDASWATAEKIAVLGGRDNSLQWIAEQLLPNLSDRIVFICENLTMDDELVRDVEPHELTALHASSRTVVLIIKKSLLK
jgi:precorrin-6y C5,15-methyltransferase (decarboxylating) CbiE subunit